MRTVTCSGRDSNPHALRHQILSQTPDALNLDEPAPDRARTSPEATATAPDRAEQDGAEFRGIFHAPADASDAAPAPRPKARPEAVDHYAAASGKRYVRVTAGGPGQPAPVVEYRSGTLACLRSTCLAEQKAQRCGHVAAARDYLELIDARAAAGVAASPAAVGRAA